MSSIDTIANPRSHSIFFPIASRQLQQQPRSRVSSSFNNYSSYHNDRRPRASPKLVNSFYLSSEDDEEFATTGTNSATAEMDDELDDFFFIPDTSSSSSNYKQLHSHKKFPLSHHNSSRQQSQRQQTQPSPRESASRRRTAGSSSQGSGAGRSLVREVPSLHRESANAHLVFEITKDLVKVFDPEYSMAPCEGGSADNENKEESRRSGSPTERRSPSPPTNRRSPSPPSPSSQQQTQRRSRRSSRDSTNTSTSTTSTRSTAHASSGSDDGDDSYDPYESPGYAAGPQYDRRPPSCEGPYPYGYSGSHFPGPASEYRGAGLPYGRRGAISAPSGKNFGNMTDGEVEEMMRSYENNRGGGFADMYGGPGGRFRYGRADGGGSGGYRRPA